MKNLAPPTLALQKEELDEHNNQATPPGFHLVFLPFADDLRKLRYEETPKGSLISYYNLKHCKQKYEFKFLVVY